MIYLEPGMDETILDILQSLREVPTFVELKYRDAITGIMHSSSRHFS